MPTTRYVYPDNTKNSSFTANGNAVKGTIDNGSNYYSLSSAPIIGTSGVSDLVKEGTVSPDDNDYWYGDSVSSSGTIKMTLEPLQLDYNYIQCYFRAKVGLALQGAEVSNIYLYYSSAQNPSMTQARAYYASGAFTPYNFDTIGIYQNNIIQLIINSGSIADSSAYGQLLYDGIPEIEFGFLAGDDSYTSAFNLYGSGNTTYPSVTGIIPLYIGGMSSASGTIPLYTNSATYISGITDLYLNGSAKSSGTTDLYTYGSAPSSGTVNLFAGGPTLISGVTDLYICGPLSSSGNIDLYIYGHAIASGVNFPLFIGHNTNNYSSGNLPLYLWSTTNSGIFAHMPLSINPSSINNEQILPLYINGVSNTFSSGIFPLYLSCPYTWTSSGVDLTVWNAYTASSGAVPLYMSAPSGTLGAIPSSGNMILYLHRLSGTYDNVPMSISGPVLSSGNVNLFLLCAYPVNSGIIPMYEYGAGQSIAYTTLYSHGF